MLNALRNFNNALRSFIHINLIYQRWYIKLIYRREHSSLYREGFFSKSLLYSRAMKKGLRYAHFVTLVSYTQANKNDVLRVWLGLLVELRPKTDGSWNCHPSIALVILQPKSNQP